MGRKGMPRRVMTSAQIGHLLMRRSGWKRCWSFNLDAGRLLIAVLLPKRGGEGQPPVPHPGEGRNLAGAARREVEIPAFAGMTRLNDDQVKSCPRHKTRAARRARRRGSSSEERRVGKECGSTCRSRCAA